MNAVVQHIDRRQSVAVLTPTTFAELKDFADIAAISGMVPKDFVGKPGAIMIAVQMGAELGLSPTQALQSIAVINGRPGVWGDGLIGLCRGSPLCEDIIETIEGQDDARAAVCIAKRRGASPVERRFSVADAKRAGLWGKDVWAKYPERMLVNRARGFALRDAFPDVLRGLKTGEELIDTPPDDFRGTTIDARAERPQPARRTETATNPESSPNLGKQTPLEQVQTQRAADQRAATTPPPKKMTISEFLDGLDRELERAPEAGAVEALMRSTRVTEARAFMTNGAADRLAAWTERAEAKRQSLLDDQAEANVPETITAPDPLLGDMPSDLDAWPLAGEDMAAG